MPVAQSQFVASKLHGGASPIFTGHQFRLVRRTRRNGAPGSARWAPTDESTSDLRRANFLGRSGFSFGGCKLWLARALEPDLLLRQIRLKRPLLSWHLLWWLREYSVKRARPQTAHFSPRCNERLMQVPAQFGCSFVCTYANINGNCTVKRFCEKFDEAWARSTQSNIEPDDMDTDGNYMRSAGVTRPANGWTALFAVAAHRLCAAIGCRSPLCICARPLAPR